MITHPTFLNNRAHEIWRVTTKQKVVNHKNRFAVSSINLWKISYLHRQEKKKNMVMFPYLERTDESMSWVESQFHTFPFWWMIGNHWKIQSWRRRIRFCPYQGAHSRWALGRSRTHTWNKKPKFSIAKIRKTHLKETLL